MTVIDRISSTDSGYQAGDLSVFPISLDDQKILYSATNNTSTLLKQTLPYNGKTIIVEDASVFPASGQVRIGPRLGEGEFELIYYDKKVGNTFQDLKRGFAGSKQNYWAATINYVTNAVVADHHNAIKDAVLNLETDLGVYENPDATSLNGILKHQEQRFLAPRPIFRASSLLGPAPLKVRFQNFSTGDLIRYFWDFGDGGTSLEKSPSHTYDVEGQYTVKLNIITSTGAQGVATKNNYITVDADESTPFFYVDSIDDPYSIETAAGMSPPTEPKTFWFVDQSDGDITERNWIFGDGSSETQQDPDKHDVTHRYTSPGEYIVTLLIIFVNGRLKRIELPEPLTVL
jgi:PKD repeat protein